ncbi:PAS domain S-box protein [Haloarchaeobius sp. HME9146]|uniref:hybrid sensor histidine kinase/response regulator n=1 Tax=Haloarchaeobius sp. HME9146 TaxID=2978732 RepID=UPI0021BE9D3A|nr:PAS domain S-box protein [Haloarchaeobius sp. HME9146]MCT9096307.1 PAS domain S-box protein [Haloarchaeobius sp. HME9146]
MSATSTVLVISNDAELRERLAAPLEWSYPNVDVLTAAGFDGIIDHLDDGSLDCIVADDATALDSPAIFQATRERHPDLPLLVLSEYNAERGDGVAVMEVVDFLDSIGTPGSDDAFAGWVANSVVRNHGTAAPPGGNRPEDVVRDVKRSLVDASSPMDIEEAVCDQLTLGGRYKFAWVGEYDRGERQVVPWVAASETGDWPISMTFPVGRSGRQSVIDRALRSREVQIINDIEAHEAAVPWRATATERDCNAVAIAPLAYEDELYGILGVYSNDDEGFDEMETSAVREIASSVSHVLDTIAIRGRIDQQERVLRRYERLVETVGDGMYVLDSDGHFMTVNNAMMSMTGYSREGLLGEHISIILDDESISAGRDIIRRMVRDRRMEGETQEVVVETKDGRTFPGEVQIALLPFEDEQFRGTVGVVRDVTERKKREQELQRQNERLDAFASIVSHDLRNPLGVSQGYLDLVKEQTDDSVATYIQHVEDGLDRMEDIVADVLAIARQGQTVTETEPTDLEDIVREAWSNVDTKSATLTVGESMRLAADRSRLLRALENLFRNAVEHGGEDVAIDVGLLEPPTVDDGETEVSTGGFEFPGEDNAAPEEPELTRPAGFYVADDGEGMPKTVRENAFDSEFTTSEDGLGIGLWVVREVASAHGWTTRVVESAEGGARFEFSDVKPA